MGSSAVRTIADLLREFNYHNGTTTAYKAFYNRLAQQGFARFMRQMASELLTRLMTQTLAPRPGGLLAQFKDIVIQDGTSFALKDALRDVFPGRFTTAEPAAVELHATYSGFADQVTRVVITPDKESERAFLPRPEDLEGKLLLADRGYPSLPYFNRLAEAGASFVVRLTRGWKPYVLAVHQSKRIDVLANPVSLPEFLAQHPNCPFDLDVAMGSKRSVLRLVVLPAKHKAMTRLCTNLPRDRFSLVLVGQLYRFRWQVELCFKEWKSHSNLHAFDTANPHVAEGLIWAALATAIVNRFMAHAAQAIAVVPISTQKVAMCATHFLRDLLIALNRQPSTVPAVLAASLTFLLANARRADPQRDRFKGRQAAGLALVGGGLK